MSWSVSSDAFAEMERIILQSGENADKLAPEMLTAAAKIYQAAHQGHIAKLNKIAPTGLLESSIEFKVEKGKSGWAASISPEGYRDYGRPERGDPRMVSNAQIATMLEFGTSQEPRRPWRAPANEQAKDEAAEAMRKVWEDGSI